MIWFLLYGCGSEPAPEVTPPNAAVTTAPANIGPPHQHSGPKHPPHPGGAHHGPPKGPSLKVTPTFELTGETAAQPKSLILISLDTVSAERLEVYGGRAKMPALNKLAASGVVFEQAISQFPETALSHWSMMSGVFPAVHGNVPGNGGSRYKGPTLAEVAKKFGYGTGAFIGGVTMTDQASGFSRGFDVYDDQFTFNHTDMSRSGSIVTKRAQSWIAQQQGPYFAFVHYFDAHFPYTPRNPQMYDPNYKGTLDGSDAKLRPYRDGEKEPSARDVEHILALYDAEISELDPVIAPLLSLASDDTVVLVTADHGESFSHNYYFNHREGLWDEVLRVPWIMAGGGLPAQRVQQQVGLIDVFPTITAVLGLPSDRRVQGRNVLASDLAEQAQISITDPWMPVTQQAVRTDRWKWILHSDKWAYLYEHSIDPKEQQNRSEKEQVAELPAALDVYKSKIQSLGVHQAAAPKQREISETECARLEALGYTTCKK